MREKENENSNKGFTRVQAFNWSVVGPKYTSHYISYLWRYVYSIYILTSIFIFKWDVLREKRRYDYVKQQHRDRLPKGGQSPIHEVIINRFFNKLLLSVLGLTTGYRALILYFRPISTSTDRVLPEGRESFFSRPPPLSYLPIVLSESFRIPTLDRSRFSVSVSSFYQFLSNSWSFLFFLYFPPCLWIRGWESILLKSSWIPERNNIRGFVTSWSTTKMATDWSHIKAISYSFQAEPTSKYAKSQQHFARFHQDQLSGPAIEDMFTTQDDVRVLLPEAITNIRMKICDQFLEALNKIRERWRLVSIYEMTR